jgi:tetratricopeptide (TPR) repeat protein
MRFSTLRTFILFSAIAAIVLLILAPNLPAEKRAGKGQQDPRDQRLRAAIVKVESANPMEGILELRQLADEFPDYTPARLYLGHFSLQSGQTEKAVEHFERVLEIEPENAEAHWQLGFIHYGNAEAEKAVFHLKEVLRINHEDYFAAHYFLAQALENIGDFEGAIDNYEHVLTHTDDMVVIEKVEEELARLKSN